MEDYKVISDCGHGQVVFLGTKEECLEFKNSQENPLSYFIMRR